MLNVVSFSDAKKIIEDKLTFSPVAETVGIDCALGMVTADDVISDDDVPSFNRSTVDGFAVIASDTYGAGESMPSLLDIKREILMGQEAAFEIGKGECAKISTGGMLPAGANAVVMVENTECEDDNLCLVFKSVSPFENVTKKSDDVCKGEIVIPSGTELKASHIGILAAIGSDKVKVRRRISVAVISTGDEIVKAGDSPSPGQVRDINSHLLCSLVKSRGFGADSLGIIHDDYSKIYDTIRYAAENYDVVLVSGGSSAGVRDMTVDIISGLGEVYAHGIAVKPGKPTIIGKIGDTPVFGLPGHPAAAYFVTLSLVIPLLEKCAGIERSDGVINCPVKGNVSSNHGREEFLCVRIEDGFAVPNYAKSGIVSLLSKSDGYIVIDRNTEGIKSGDMINVHLF